MNYNDSDIKTFVLLGGITTLPALALPVGWWLYNSYRVCWLKVSRGGYENHDFIKILKKDTKPFYSPLTESVLIDFSMVKGIESWMSFDLELYRKMFYPFYRYNRFKTIIRKYGISLKFSEPISDIILFNDSTYDYARSISSVRYGMESSAFALVLGGVFAFGIKVIWLFNLGVVANYPQYIFWMVLLMILVVLVNLTLLVRWWYADKEYDARLLLSTVITFRNNYFRSNSCFEARIPKEVLNKIEELDIHSKAYSIFRLENALISNNIEEAILAVLIKNKNIDGFKWVDYQMLLKKDKEEAQSRIKELFVGIEIYKIRDITNELIKNTNDFLEVEGFSIPIPKPNLVAQALVSLIRTKGIDVIILSDINQISSEIICWHYFGIPSPNVFGVKLSTSIFGRIKKSLDSLYEVRNHKIVQKCIEEKILVAGGSNIEDKHIFDISGRDVIKLFFGENLDDFSSLKDLNLWLVPM